MLKFSYDLNIGDSCGICWYLSFFVFLGPDLRLWKYTLPAITCLKLTIETLEQGVKYVQSYVQASFWYLYC